MDYLTLFTSCMDGRKDFEKLDDMNKIEVQLMYLFMMIALHRYEWKGLPKELPAWQLEFVLNYYGNGVFFDYLGKKIICSATQSGDLDIYGQPTRVRPVAVNGTTFDDKTISLTLSQNKEILEPDAVLIRNNDFSIPTFFMIKPVIDRLCFIWESLGINEGLSRVKALIHANKDVSGVVKTEIRKIFGSRDAFPVVSEKLNTLKEIEKVDLSVEYTPMEYWDDFDATFNLACQLVGIKTESNMKKRERKSIAEVKKGDSVTTTIADTSLEHRKIGCEQVNEMFGLSISVEEKGCSELPEEEDDDMANKGMLTPLNK